MSKLHEEPLDANNQRTQVFNVWAMCENPKEFLGFVSHDMVCPHARAYLALECFKVYLEVKNELDDKREKERKHADKVKKLQQEQEKQDRSPVSFGG